MTGDERAALREHDRFIEAVEHGLDDIEAGRVLTTDELKAALGPISWE